MSSLWLNIRFGVHHLQAEGWRFWINKSAWAVRCRRKGSWLRAHTPCVKVHTFGPWHWGWR